MVLKSVYFLSISDEHTVYMYVREVKMILENSFDLFQPNEYPWMVRLSDANSKISALISNKKRENNNFGLYV